VAGGKEKTEFFDQPRSQKKRQQGRGEGQQLGSSEATPKEPLLNLAKKKKKREARASRCLVRNEHLLDTKESPTKLSSRTQGKKKKMRRG